MYVGVGLLKTIPTHNSTTSIFTSDGVLTSRAFLGHRGLVAVHTVEVVLVSSEASSSQRLLAGVAHEAFRVPWFILIVDPTRGDGLEKWLTQKF